MIPAASTGKASNSNTAVISTDQTKSGVVYCVREGGFMLMHVVIKLIAPRIEDTPAK